MADTKFTLGPWSTKLEPDYYPESDDADLPYPVRGPDGKEIVTVFESYRITGSYEANAHLIAAAPELYEALYRLVRDCEIAGMQEQAGFDCWISMANAALAKARGEAA